MVVELNYVRSFSTVPVSVVMPKKYNKWLQRYLERQTEKERGLKIATNIFSSKYSFTKFFFRKNREWVTGVFKIELTRTYSAKLANLKYIFYVFFCSRFVLFILHVIQNWNNFLVRVRKSTSRIQNDVSTEASLRDWPEVEFLVRLLLFSQLDTKYLGKL